MSFVVTYFFFLLFMFHILRVFNVGNPAGFFVSSWKAILSCILTSRKLFTKKKRRFFHICHDLYFYFTGQGTSNADQKQSFLKDPIQVKGKEIPYVSKLCCC